MLEVPSRQKLDSGRGSGGGSGLAGRFHFCRQGVPQIADRLESQEGRGVG